MKKEIKKAMRWLLIFYLALAGIVVVAVLLFAFGVKILIESGFVAATGYFLVLALIYGILFFPKEMSQWLRRK